MNHTIYRAAGKLRLIKSAAILQLVFSFIILLIAPAFADNGATPSEYNATGITNGGESDAPAVSATDPSQPASDQSAVASDNIANTSSNDDMSTSSKSISSDTAASSSSSLTSGATSSFAEVSITSSQPSLVS